MDDAQKGAKIVIDIFLIKEPVNFFARGGQKFGQIILWSYFVFSG